MSQFFPRRPPWGSLNLASSFLRIFENTLLSSLNSAKCYLRSVLVFEIIFLNSYVIVFRYYFIKLHTILCLLLCTCCKIQIKVVGHNSVVGKFIRTGDKKVLEFILIHSLYFCFDKNFHNWQIPLRSVCFSLFLITNVKNLANLIS